MSFTGTHKLPWAKWFNKPAPKPIVRKEIPIHYSERNIEEREKSILDRKRIEYIESGSGLSFDEWCFVDKK
jgi:hypothetical protein